MNNQNVKSDDETETGKPREKTKELVYCDPI